MVDSKEIAKTQKENIIKSDDLKEDVLVYTAKIPENCDIDKVYPEARNEEIARVTNYKVKLEKFVAWKLLRHAVMNAFGDELESLKLEKQMSGKWTCDKFYFSISHSHGMVAVAVSKKAVGVDVELLEIPKENAIERVLTPLERAELESINEEKRWEFLVETWSKKESLFKAKGEDKFYPSKLDTIGKNIVTKRVKIDNKQYVLSVYSENCSKIEYCENVQLDL